MSDTPENCARELLEVVPLVMQNIRSQMRSRRTSELTVPQFRTLLFVNRNAGSSLSEVAEFMGLALPSTSKLVDDLLKHGLITREEQPADRRRVKLAVTLRGQRILEASQKGTLAYLAERLAVAKAGDRQTIVGAMQTLRVVFEKQTKM